MKQFLIIAVFLCSAMAMQAQAPAWVATHGHERYQPSQYLIGVGMADGANAVGKAKKNAQVDLVSQIRVQVKGEMKNVTESYQLNKDEVILSDFTTKTRTVVNDEVAGIEFVETYVDPATQTAYALAALDRAKYTQGLAGEMNAAWTQSSALRASADGFLKRGRLQDALQSMSDARKLILSALPKIALHDAVAGTAYAAPNALTPASLTNDMRTMLSNVKIEKLGGDTQKGKIGTRFAVPLSVRVTVDGVPASGTSVRFVSADNLPLAEPRTDDRGEVQYRGCIRALSGSVILVKPALGELSREFGQSADAASVQFTYATQPSDIGIELAVSGVKGKSADDVKTAVASAVGAAGYRILPSSRYRLETVLRPKPALKTEGMSGRLYTVQVEAVLALTDKQSRTERGSITSKAAGNGRSENEAAEKAASKLAVDRMKLAELIEQVAQ